MSSTNGGSGGARPARLPRWTRQEILILIEGKRSIESRGKPGRCTAAGPTSPAVEPKWASVSAHCRRRGVDRGAVQCRKRWSNLAGDFKKIKEWESRRGDDDQRESFWAMRNDARRERRLPGFFDREVFDVLDGGDVHVAAAEEEEAVFDSGRTAAEDGLFSDFEEEKDGDDDEEETTAAEATAATAAAVTPISEKKFEFLQQESSDSGMPKDKQPEENPEKGPSPLLGQKRRRTTHEEPEDSSLQSKLIEVLERNSRMLTDQLDAQNVNNQLERDQRKDHTESLLGILSKVADALGRIADKL